jgi:short-subunit dehydrogenase
MPKHALITGATSGIGYELTRLFAHDGHNVVLVARSSNDLDRVAAECRGLGVTAHTIAKDLTKPGSPDEVFAEIRSRNIPINFLVNNAGYALYGPFAKSNLADDLANMQLNMVALVHLTRLFLDDMIARREGRILNLASTAAFQPGPMMALYYASKAFVLSFSEALHDELRPAGVTVTALCPGPTQTGFQSKAGVEGIRLVSGRLMDAAAVAKDGYRAMMRGKPVVISGFKNQVMMWGSKLSPRSIPIAIVRRLHQRA